jgi:AraC-like DNA-binding protein
VSSASPLSSYPLIETANVDVAQEIVSRELTNSRINRVGDESLFRFEMNGARFGDTLVGWNRYSTDVDVNSGTVEDTIAFVIGTGRPVFHVAGEPLVCTDSAGVLVEPSRMSIERPAGSSIYALKTDCQSLERRFWDVTGVKPRGRITFEHKVNISTGPGAALRDTLLTVVSQMETNKTLLTNRLFRIATDELLLTTLLSLPNSHTEILLREPGDVAPTVVHRAEEFLAAHAADPIKMQDVCTACGCHRNLLYRAFKQYRGYTPNEFLQNRRLEAARQKLVFPSETDTVTSIALASGFPHLSRFAALYKRNFRESPSETLRRSR